MNNYDDEIKILIKDPLIKKLYRKQLKAYQCNTEGYLIDTPYEALAEKRISMLAIAHGAIDSLVKPEHADKKQLFKTMMYELIKNSTVVYLSDSVYDYLGELTKKIHDTYIKIDPDKLPVLKKLPFESIFFTNRGGFNRVDHFGNKFKASFDLLTPPDDFGHVGYSMDLGIPAINILSLLDADNKPLLAGRAYNDAFAMLLEEKIAVVESIKIMSVDRKKIKKNGADNIYQDEEIKIIKFREVERSSGHKRSGESNIEYHRRWLVRGHLRNQYYPATDSYQTIWIDPYVKGPEDKPFIESIRHGVR